MGKEVVDQVLAVELVLSANPVLVIVQCGLDGFYRADGLAGGFFDRHQHEQHPVLPAAFISHGLQQTVVLGLVPNYVAAQVKHRNIEHPALEQVEDVDDAPGTAVAVVERMNAFELVVDQRHLHQWVGVEQLVVIDELLQVTHKPDDIFRMLRRRVDHSPHAVLQGGPGQTAQASGVALELRLNRDDLVGGQQTRLAHRAVADIQGLAVTQDFLGCRAAGGVGKSIVAEQIVMGGDDVFDGGAVLGLLHAEGIDQDALMRNGGCHSLELGQGAARRNQLLEDRPRFETGGIQLLQAPQFRHGAEFLSYAYEQADSDA
ncbi:hypothetical protein D3C85_1146920 [compost metagenome]